MDFLDLGIGWRAPGADGPYRLVGNDRGAGAGAIGERAPKLRFDDVESHSSVTLLLGLPDADDRRHAACEDGRRLGFDRRIPFAVVGAALGMADDHEPAPEFSQHAGADVTGMGSLLRGMAILGAKLDGGTGNRSGDGLKKRERGANHHVECRIGFRCHALG